MSFITHEEPPNALDTTKKTSRNQNDESAKEEKRRKARLRKQRNRNKNPQANRMNDLKARVRKRSLEIYGYYKEDWIQQQCYLRLQKRLFKEQTIDDEDDEIDTNSNDKENKSKINTATTTTTATSITVSSITTTTATPSELPNTLTPDEVDVIHSLLLLRSAPHCLPKLRSKSN
ncbi:hypothetical protein K502DRAFT_329211 [Neoconidiobolus thromboides FSU 785]|nr:hypothetical protein K502DRAFT_329211 [Neoconidiobolus thromboides FSU 785]